MWWLICSPCAMYLPGIQCFFLLLMPLMASICGPDLVVRLSLMLMLHTCLADVIPVIKRIPLLPTALMVALFALPIDLFPSVLVWAYTQVILSSEPLLMAFEAIAVVYLVTQTGTLLVSYIQDSPLLVKSAVLGIAVISYVFSVSLALILFLSDTSQSIKWFLAFVAMMSVALLIFTIVKDEGIISDCALISFYLIWCLWVMQHERNLSAHPLKPPATWQRNNLSSVGSSLGQILYSFLHLRFENVSSSLWFMWSLLSPTTICMVVMRSFVILESRAIASKIPLPAFGMDKDDSWSMESDSEDEDDDDAGDRRFRIRCKVRLSSLPLKLALLFVYTQLIVYNVESSVNPSKAFVISNTNFKNWLFWGDVPLFRLMQVTLCGLFYVWHVCYNSEEMDDADWY